MWNLIKKLIPSSLKKMYAKIKYNPILLLAKDYYYDFSRFIKYSASVKQFNKENYAAFLIKEYHAIEKGLALRHPKKSFGVPRFIKFTKRLDEYLKLYGKDNITNNSIAALEKYREFEEINKNFNNPIINEFDLIKQHYYSDGTDKFSSFGGAKIVKKVDIINTLPTFEFFNFFFKSRHSTRDFSQAPVNKDDIADVISTALSTPSVCNRQPWKVYMVDRNNSKLRDKFLKVQNGNKGFGQYIDTLLIVTGKLSNFFLIERNQVFIDGGMFAMSIVMGLHAKGLGACCLNTSYTSTRDKEFRKVIDIDQDCVPIMFIGIGHLKDEYKVAVSRRKDISEVLINLK